MPPETVPSNQVAKFFQGVKRTTKHGGEKRWGWNGGGKKWGLEAYSFCWWHEVSVRICGGWCSIWLRDARNREEVALVFHARRGEG